jgi:hypothetical protein
LLASLFGVLLNSVYVVFTVQKVSKDGKTKANKAGLFRGNIIRPHLSLVKMRPAFVTTSAFVLRVARRNSGLRAGICRKSLKKLWQEDGG